MDNEIKLNKILKQPQPPLEPPRKMNDIKIPPKITKVGSEVPVAKEPEFRFLPPLMGGENITKSKKRKSLPKINLLVGGLILLLLVLGVSAYYFYNKSKLITTTTDTAQLKLDAAVAEISKVTILPITDQPTLFVVSDPEQLKADAFFINSQIGDEMLLYPHLGRAFLYRPLTKQIVNIMSFNPNSPVPVAPENNLKSSSTTATTSATSTLSR